jgi:hypothetical protein
VCSGDKGVHPTGTNHPFRNFGPRVGFAYSPDWGKLTGGPGKTSIRGGFGMYYNRTEEELNLQFQGVPPNSIATNGAGTDGGSPGFANPFVDIAGRSNFNVPNPFPFTGAPSNVQFTAANGYLPIWSACCSTIDPRNVDPTSYNYNLTIERQVTASTIASVGYVGAFARHLEIGHPLNLVNPAPCIAAGPNVCSPGNQLTTFPGDYLYPGNVYGTIDQISTFGNSHYNSLQVAPTMTRRSWPAVVMSVMEDVWLPSIMIKLVLRSSRRRADAPQTAKCRLSLQTCRSSAALRSSDVACHRRQ